MSLCIIQLSGNLLCQVLMCPVDTHGTSSASVIETSDTSVHQPPGLDIRNAEHPDLRITQFCACTQIQHGLHGLPSTSMPVLLQTTCWVVCTGYNEPNTTSFPYLYFHSFRPELARGWKFGCSTFLTSRLVRHAEGVVSLASNTPSPYSQTVSLMMMPPPCLHVQFHT